MAPFWANKILLLITPKDPKHADLFKMMSEIPALLPVAIKAHALALCWSIGNEGRAIF